MGQVKIIAGLLWGDETKGATTDYLAARDGADLVVRYNGGAQAAHNVVLENGDCHTFNQFGSGTFSNSRTYLSRFFRFAPFALVGEAKHLMEMGIKNPYDLLTVDERCLVITPFQAAHSRFQANVHKRGTTGVGVGQAYRYSLEHPESAVYVGDFMNPFGLYDKLAAQADHYASASRLDPFIQSMQNPARDTASFLTALGNRLNITNETGWLRLRDESRLILFEGAQGVQLDKDHGNKPYVTSSDTTMRQAEILLEGYAGQIERIGLLRMYANRHGAGDFPTWTPLLDQLLPEVHNIPNPYQGTMRRGWMDLDRVRHSLGILGNVDYLSVSHLDYFKRLPEWKIQIDGALQGGFRDLDNYLDFISQQTCLPIGILGYGERKEDRKKNGQSIIRQSTTY